MLILTIRTDNPEAEIGLFEGRKKLAYETWQAHRQLAETIHQQIAKILQFSGKEWSDINGMAVYKGPGSFTGLRIGFGVANGLAYGLNIPIVAAAADEWIEEGVGRLLSGETDTIALPEYGMPLHVTLPKK